MKIKNITIIGGAGTMGHGIAFHCARFGYKIKIMDIKEDLLVSALSKIRKKCEDFVKVGLIKENNIQTVLSRIETTTNLEESVKEADIIIETVPENLKLKKEILQKVDKFSKKDAIISSNTSSLSITELAKATKKPDKVIGTHFINPPHLIPLVEIILGENTSSETVEKIKEFLKSTKKDSIVLSKNIPACLHNMLLYSIIREATDVVEKGWASEKDVDKAIKTFFGLRFPVIGLFELIDIAGIDIAGAVSNNLFKLLSDSKEMPKIFKEKINSKKLGIKTGEGFYKWHGNRAKEKMSSFNMYLLKKLIEHEKGVE